MLIKWRRSTGDHVESHCGRWRISPLYCGRTRPEAFLLWDHEKSVGEFQTQRDAKADAQDRVDRGVTTARHRPNRISTRNW
jgi:hypothetical protein